MQGVAMENVGTIGSTRALEAQAGSARLAGKSKPAVDGAGSLSRTRLWTSRLMSGLAIAFLLMDAALKVLQVPAAVEGTVQIGYAAKAVVGIGIVQLICLLVHAIPRTAVLGAVLLTGYLGGAVATHVRVADPLFTHTLFPIYVAALIWGALYLRDPRVHGALGPQR